MDIKKKTNGINGKDEFGRTPLMDAVAIRDNDKDGSLSAVRLYIEAGADLNLSDKYGRTALIMAALHSRKGSSEDIVRLLIEAGADLNLKDNNGWTALMYSVLRSQTHSTEGTVQLLVEAGADLNLKDSEGLTALDIARTTGATRIVQMLEEALASGRGMPPAYEAVSELPPAYEDIV